MRWCINQGLDGVITDDPEKFLEVCKDYGNAMTLPKDRKALRGKEAFKPRDWFDIIKIHFLVALFLLLFKWKFGWSGEKRFIRMAVMPVEKT